MVENAGCEFGGIRFCTMRLKRLGHELLELTHLEAPV